MSTSFISFLDELEQQKSFFTKKIEDSPLKNQEYGQPKNSEIQMLLSYKKMSFKDSCNREEFIYEYTHRVDV